MQDGGTGALNHHEHWDGEGYPAGLAGQAIPESARIVAIVDVYDALTHDRGYRPAMPEDKVLAIMQQGAGTHFDPLLLATFFSHVPEISRIAQENQENPDEPGEEPVPAASATSLLERADRALYQAKTAGRNRVIVCPAPSQLQESNQPLSEV